MRALHRGAHGCRAQVIIR